MAKLLPNPVIQSLYKAAVAVHLDRNVLLAGLPPSFTHSLSKAEQPGAQLLTDLLRLNQIDRLDDGTVPLREWLETAEMLAGPQAEAAVFRDALHQLNETKLASVAPQRTEPVPADARAREQALRRVFLDMFSADEVRSFVRYLPQGREMEGSLPGAGSPFVAQVNAVVDVAVRMSAIDGAFFDSLVAERPRRKAEIDRVRRMFGV